MLEFGKLVLLVVLNLVVYVAFLMVCTAIFGPKRFWCGFMGLHRWDSPGGSCVDCEKHDDFFDTH